MKVNVEWQICRCGAHLFPPKAVSDVGVEDYEEVYEVPPIEPDRVPSQEELAKINEGRRRLGLPELRSVEEWREAYREWATDFRRRAEAAARARLSELMDKLRDPAVVVEDGAIRVRGKRFEAIYEPTERGWRLRCPRCGFVTLELAYPPQVF